MAALCTPVTHKGSLPRSHASPTASVSWLFTAWDEQGSGRAPLSQALAFLLGAFKSLRGTLPETDGRRYPETEKHPHKTATVLSTDGAMQQQSPGA